RGLLHDAVAAYRQQPGAARLLARHLERLDEPLRVAVAGRLKAGKSTLLNALVGERLAPTDAGECTRYVTWYTYGDGYDVWFETQDGGRTRLPFTREEGRLEIDVTSAGGAPGRIRVAWPSSRLKGLTLIDTPGLGSLSEGVAERTEAALATRDSTPDADAVLYLM